MSQLIGVEKKVQEIFSGIVGSSNSMFENGPHLTEIIKKISTAISGPDGYKNSDEIAFHLADWAEDAAFLTAIQLFPDRFTPEEIREGVESFLTHVPYHVISAAQLAERVPVVFAITDISDNKIS